MESQKRNQILKVIISFILLFTLVISSEFMMNKAEAAKKPSIEKSMTIGTGSTIYEFPVFIKDDYYTLEVKNPVKKATYTFTTSNKSIVTVKTKGTKAYLTGVKAGKATITCNQKLNGKTTKVGTCKVTVKNCTASAEIYAYDGLPVGKSDTFLVIQSYRNQDAKYTYTTDSKNLSVKEVVKKEEGSKNVYKVYQTVTAKKAGTYKVTVKETYNKKTRTVGEFKVLIEKARVSEETSLYSGESMLGFYLVEFSRYDVNYVFEAEDETILETYLDEGTVMIKGNAAGTTTLNIYEDAEKPDKSKLLGSCKVTVKELKAEELEFYFDDTEVSVGETIELVVYKYPDSAPEEIKVTSSDPSIASVDFGESSGEIKAVKEGTVTITITCGEITRTQELVITAADDEYEDEYEDDYEDDYEEEEELDW